MIPNFSIVFDPKSRKFLEKSGRLSKKSLHNFIDSNNPSNNGRSTSKKSRDNTLLFVDFSKAFDSIHRGMMGRIVLAYGLLEEAISATMKLYKNMKTIVFTLDGDADFFDRVAGV